MLTPFIWFLGVFIIILHSIAMRYKYMFIISPVYSFDYLLRFILLLIMYMCLCMHMCMLCACKFRFLQSLNLFGHWRWSNSWWLANQLACWRPNPVHLQGSTYSSLLSRISIPPFISKFDSTF